MDSTFTVFGHISRLSSILDLFNEVEQTFNIKANLFSVSDSNYPKSTMSWSAFNSAIEKYSLNDVESVTMYYCLDVKYPDSTQQLSCTVFICEEKSYLVIAYDGKEYNDIGHLNIWSVVLNYIVPYYGFWATNLKVDASLYGIGMYIYAQGVKSKISKEVYEKERFWIMNYQESKKGLMRDVYRMNVVNSAHLGNKLDGSSCTLGEFIESEKIGRLDKFRDDIFMWKLETEEQVVMAKKRLNRYHFVLL